MSVIVNEHASARDLLLEHCNRRSIWSLGLLWRAVHTIEDVFKNQKRATNDPAVEHAYGTAITLADLGFGLDLIMIIAALLHDVFEDGDDPKKLRRDVIVYFWFIGPIIYLIVEALTRKDDKDYYKQLLAFIRLLWWLGVWRAIFIKMSDVIYNHATIRGFNNYAREMRQHHKASRIVREVAIPARKYVPRKHHPKFDELFDKLTSDLPVHRQETIDRWRQRERERDLGYFPVV